MSHSLRFGGIYPLTTTPSRPLSQKEKQWTIRYERGMTRLQHKLVDQLRAQGRIEHGIIHDIYEGDSFVPKTVLITKDLQGDHCAIFEQLEKEKLEPIRQELAQNETAYYNDLLALEPYQARRTAIMEAGKKATDAMNKQLLGMAQESLQVTFMPQGNFELTGRDEDKRTVRFDTVTFTPLAKP